MTEVTWRPHPAYSGYEASSDGRVRSVDRIVKRWCGKSWHDLPQPGVELKQAFSSNGKYRIAAVCIGGKRTNVRVHRMVCEAFFGLAPGPDLEVRHLNGNGHDNRIENLCWGTASENQQDRVRHGTQHNLNKTHCPQGHEYTPENTYRPSCKPHSRECNTCLRARARERHRRRALRTSPTAHGSNT